MDYKEEAVSPVIGVILMVAITVILAAVIAVFVLGMADDVQGPKEVAITSSTDSSGTMIILQSGKDVEELDKIIVKIDGGLVPEANVFYNKAPVTNDGNVTPGAGTTFTSGDVIFLKGNTTGNLLVTGFFADGDSKVLLQKKL
jgi:flagellin-like protein